MAEKLRFYEKAELRFIILTIVIFLIFPGCREVSSNRVKNNAAAIESLSKDFWTKTVAGLSVSEKAVDFKGVKIRTDISSVDRLEGTENPAIRLELKTEKPDSTWSRHVSVYFRGPYEEEHRESFFSPQINIYPISEFRQALSKSESYVAQFDDEIARLKEIIGRKPDEIEKAPQIPFYDGTPQLRTRATYLEFNNGSGVFYLAQYNIEPSLINNRGLTYIFQGITSDGMIYVLGTFPVTLDFLPATYDEEKFGDYELPEYFHGSKNWSAHQRDYQKYLDSMRSRLNREASAAFNPSLVQIEETVRSLAVNWRD